MQVACHIGADVHGCDHATMCRQQMITHPAKPVAYVAVGRSGTAQQLGEYGPAHTVNLATPGKLSRVVQNLG